MTTWGWGGNSNGHLGVGDTTTTHTTPATLGSAADFVRSAGAAPAANGAIFIATDQTLYYAGTNVSGQFGDGTAPSSAFRTVPTAVPGLSGIVKAQAGDSCYALDSGGTLWGWGDSSFGQLATASTANQLTPISIATGVLDFDSDGDSVIILKAGGVVQTVGYNALGRLGTGSTSPTNVTSWQTVTPGSGTVVQIAFGYGCSLLRLADGSILAAGSNTGTSNLAGQFGTTAAAINPSWITLPYTNAVDVWGGYMTTFIQKNDGTIWGMGRNNQGNLGSGTASGSVFTSHVSTPTQWLSPFTGGVTLVQIGKGNLAYAFGVLGSDGKVYTWGAGDSGQMGNGSTTFANPTPAWVNGLTGQRWVAAGSLSMWSGDAVLLTPPLPSRRGWVAVIG